MLRTSVAILALLGPLPADEAVTLTVGAGGQRMFAADGLSWTGHVAWGEPKHDQNDLNVAAFFRGAAYVGGGFSIARVTATRDGRSWSEGVLPQGSPIFGLEILGDVLYAVTLRGQIYGTVDGESFERVAAAEMPTPRHWIRSTAAGNGLIVGSGDFGPVLVFDPRTGKATVAQMAGQTEKNATLIRVAFGNGVFVVGGQDGLLAASRDGVEWKNNETRPERGNVSSVVWTGSRFLAAAKNGAFASPDGLAWSPLAKRLPAKMVRAGEWIYGWSSPSHQLERSRDGESWERVPNEKQYTVKHVAAGRWAGQGAPPKLPDSRK